MSQGEFAQALAAEKRIMERKSESVADYRRFARICRERELYERAVADEAVVMLAWIGCRPVLFDALSVGCCVAGAVTACVLCAAITPDWPVYCFPPMAGVIIGLLRGRMALCALRGRYALQYDNAPRE